MRLGLSSAAAPDADLSELLLACARRGLAALELRDGDAHGVTGEPDGLDGAQARRMAREAGVELVGFRSGGTVSDERLGTLAAEADTPVLVDGADDVAPRIRRATSLRTAGARVCVVVAGDTPADVIEDMVAAGFPVAWDADAVAGGLGAAGQRILQAAGDALRHIRLIGGGPEVAMHEGRGVGALMGRLALAGYAGSLVLAPGSSRYRVAWERWLGRRGGWGCGSKTADPTLVSFDTPAPTPGGGR
jgi:sugar phosphate isomerase/epimerase